VFSPTIYMAPAKRCPLDDGDPIFGMKAQARSDEDQEPTFAVTIAINEPGVVECQPIGELLTQTGEIGEEESMNRSESTSGPVGPAGGKDSPSAAGVSDEPRRSPDAETRSGAAGPQDRSEQLTDEQIAEIEGRLRYLGYID